MLTHLHIRNFALIENLDFYPSSSFNIVTGETGAGKSVMLDAIALLLGARADSKVLFDEQSKCVIEANFGIAAYQLEEFFKEYELDYEQECIVRREINPNGKSRAFVNDTPVTLDLLKELGIRLLDIHSQHDTPDLLSSASQLALVDQLSGAITQRKELQALFKAWSAAEKNLKDAEKEIRELEKEHEFNQFLYNELKSIDFESDVLEDYESQLEVLENADYIKVKMAQAVHLLSGASPSVDEQLSSLFNLIRDIAGFSPSYQEWADRVRSSQIELRDISKELENAEESLFLDAEKMTFLQSKVNNINSLLQKHRCKNMKELQQLAAELKEKVSKVELVDERLTALRQLASQKREEAMAKAKELSSLRQASLPQMQKKIQELLRNLGMPDAQFVFDRAETELNSSGIDAIQFLFSANKGKKPESLKQVASGGELSRLMLCLKYVLASKVALPTLIFDEIDTGVSGEVAIKMAAMLAQMAQHHQLLCITHLPQMAAKGDKHFHVYKDNSAERTTSKLRELKDKERTLEIAKMIGGEKPSATAVKNAEELLQM